MKYFLDDDFLLMNKTAKWLYHEVAQPIPIFDFHSHLSAKDIADNVSFKNLTELWLYQDHYKWRLLRMNGVEERYITGDASDEDKFRYWAGTVSMAIGNPLIHWSHLELKKYFNITEILDVKSWKSIYKKANDLLKTELKAQSILKMSNVKVLCTTDDPLDNLMYHQLIRDNTKIECKVLPTFRPDGIMNIESDSFVSWVNQLKTITKVQSNVLADILKALQQRIEYFHEAGCRISDHSLEGFEYKSCDEMVANDIFNKAMEQKKITGQEIFMYKNYMLNALSKILGDAVAYWSFAFNK